jgi:hypothetical protein
MDGKQTFEEVAVSNFGIGPEEGSRLIRNIIFHM